MQYRYKQYKVSNFCIKISVSFNISIFRLSIYDGRKSYKSSNNCLAATSKSRQKKILRGMDITQKSENKIVTNDLTVIKETTSDRLHNWETEGLIIQCLGLTPTLIQAWRWQISGICETPYFTSGHQSSLCKGACADVIRIQTQNDFLLFLLFSPCNYCAVELFVKL